MQQTEYFYFFYVLSGAGLLIAIGLAVLSVNLRKRGPSAAMGAAVAAGISGVLLVGAPQFAAGQYLKGTLLVVVSFALWWVLLGWVPHLYSAVDGAVVTYRLANKPPDTGRI